MGSNTFNRILKIVSTIPKGKVSTYKQIASLASVKDIRIIGWAIHTNQDPQKVPCHRVIRSDGSLAKGYSMGGPEEQKRILINEGIKFGTNNKVNLKDFLWNQS